jgi:pyrimidine deaminase RibD-like protein
MTDINDETHLKFLQQALELARLSPPKPTNFCVGAVIVSNHSHSILSTGYTLELPGNTHAEQCALDKLDSIPEEGATIYTTMEPCILRLSGNTPCVQRILDTRTHGKGITMVVCGTREPETFVGENKGRKTLEEAGVGVLYLTGLEKDILAVATAGHV